MYELIASYFLVIFANGDIIQGRCSSQEACLHQMHARTVVAFGIPDPDESNQFTEYCNVLSRRQEGLLRCLRQGIKARFCRMKASLVVGPLPQRSN